MKKFISILPILITFVLAVQHVVKPHPKDKPVNKSINLSIYRENNYSSAAYDSTMASVHITLYKIVGDKYTTVYEKTLSSMQLKQFPDMQNAINSSLTIPNIFNKKEKLLINYAVTYNTQGSQLTLNNYMITNAANRDNLKINI
jgi:hypothetical protein